MALAVSTVINAISHVLGGGQPNSQVGGAVDIINRAGKDFFNANQWEFTSRIATLDLVAGQSYVELPSDFLQLDAIEATQSLVYSMRMTSKDELLELRTYNVNSASFHFSGAIFYNDNTAAEGGPPVAVLELWPIPVSNQSGVFTCAYRRRWPEISEDSKVVGIPDYCDELFLHWCRTYAAGWEAGNVMEGDSAFLAMREQLTASDLFRSAVEQDNATQTEYGPLQGGHIGSGLMWRDWGLHSSVGAPS